MRRAATAAAIAIALTVVAPAIAHADEGDVTPLRGCVTRAEYKRVHASMTQERVERIFGAGGRSYKLTSSFNGIQYRMCKRVPGASFVAVMYRGHDYALGSHWRVRGKEWSTSRAF